MTACCSSVLLLVCGLMLQPVWATNDDVALAMLGSGFGIADTPTSQLVFAHPLYGVALIALTPVLGTATHGWLTIIGLMLASAVLGLALSPLRFGWMALAACWFALLLPATLSPQFTVTSGLLFAAGAAWFIAEGQGRRRCVMAISALVFAFILRPESFYLGFLLLAPVLLVRQPWRAGRPRELLLICLTIIVIGAATDWLWLQAQPSWKEAFRANSLRAVFTDFHRVPWISGSPAYQTAGWTKLDYTVFMDWYPYHEIFSPDRLAALIKAVARPPLVPTVAAWSAWFAMPWGWNQITLALGAVLALGLAIRPWSCSLAWAAGALVCLALLGWSGRPPLERVWLALLGITGFAAAALSVRAAGRRGQGIAILLSLLIAAAVTEHAITDHETRLAAARKYQGWLMEHPFPAGKPVVVWAAALKYEWVVPVLTAHNPFPRPGIIGIGALADSPVQREVRERLGITDVSAWLCGGPGTTLVALDRQIPLLTQFCSERMGSAPAVRLIAHYDVTDIYELSR